MVKFLGLRRLSRVVDVARSASSQSSSRPNKRMHATADTTDVKFRERLVAARDARR
jgi:hypothetical protein